MKHIACVRLLGEALLLSKNPNPFVNAFGRQVNW